MYKTQTVEELIKELETFDGKLDVRCALRNGDVYDIVGFDVGKYIQGVRIKPFCKIVVSNWDLGVK